MISKLKVENYKSLKDVEIDFHSFNVLIGPNNSGKSNILDCLAFLADTAMTDISTAFAKRGGYDHLIFGGQTEEEIKIAVEIVDKTKIMRFNVAFREYGVIKEKLTLTDSQKMPIRTKILIDGSEGSGRYFDEEERVKKKYHYGKETLALRYFRDRRRHRTIMNFANQIKKWKFYHFVPFEMRGVFSATKKFDPGHKGKEAARTLHSLVSEYPHSYFTEIEDTLKSAINEIDDLRAPLTERGETYIAIKEKGFERVFDHHQVSDGTLRFLAHLMVLLSPKSKLPSLACFEEPENFVNPRLLELLAEILKKARTQVIVTTHSPYFIDFVEPEDLIIVEKKEGKTVSKRLSKKELEKFMEDFSLGELWYSGKIGGVP